MELPDLVRELAPLDSAGARGAQALRPRARPRRRLGRGVTRYRAGSSRGAGRGPLARRAFLAHRRGAAPRGRRLREVPLRVAARRPGRGGAHPALRRQVRRLRVEPGRLRAGVRLLRDGADGLPAESRRRGRSSTRSGRSAPRRTAGLAAWCSWGWASRCSTPPRCSGPRASCPTRRATPSPEGRSPSPRRAWVPAIDRYVREGHPYRLAFSVTSAIPEKRVRLMPVERTHPLPELVAGHRRVRRGRGASGRWWRTSASGASTWAGRTPRRSATPSPGSRSSWT